MDLLIQKLIDLIQQTAPVLWEIARRQVVAINVQDALIVIVIVVTSYFLIRYMNMCLINPDYYALQVLLQLVK